METKRKSQESRALFCMVMVLVLSNLKNPVLLDFKSNYFAVTIDWS